MSVAAFVWRSGNGAPAATIGRTPARRRSVTNKRRRASIAAATAAATAPRTNRRRRSLETAYQKARQLFGKVVLGALEEGVISVIGMSEPLSTSWTVTFDIG